MRSTTRTDTGSSGRRGPSSRASTHHENSSRVRRILRGIGEAITHASATPVTAALPASASGATPPSTPPSASAEAPARITRPL
nr:hypothetical protein [Deltaproteobacteria bacterium]